MQEVEKINKAGKQAEQNMKEPGIFWIGLLIIHMETETFYDQDKIIHDAFLVF